VNVLRPADLAEEVPEVVALREAGELGYVVETHVHDSTGSGTANCRKKGFRGFLGESNR